jgi:hypothetical protein
MIPLLRDECIARPPALSDAGSRGDVATVACANEPTLHDHPLDHTCQCAWMNVHHRREVAGREPRKHADHAMSAASR